MSVALVEAQQSQAAQQDVLPCSIPAVAGSRLAFSWGTGPQLRVAEVCSSSTGFGGQQPHAGFCEWGDTPAEQRRVAYKVMPLYRTLQRKLLSLGPERHAEAKEARQQYSAAVLDILMADRSDPALGPPDEAMLQTAYEAGMWQLLELFFLNNDSVEGLLAEAFVLWMREHGGLLNDTPGCNQLQAEALRLSELQRLDMERTYWPTVLRLVMLGQVDIAVKLLTQHPAYQALEDPEMASKVKVLDDVYQLLRTMPRLVRSDVGSREQLVAVGMVTDDVMEFSANRPVWQSRVLDVYGRHQQSLVELKVLDAAAAEGLARLLQLMSAGSQDQRCSYQAHKLMAETSHNWVELLVGMLLWEHPNLPLLGLKPLAQKAIAAPGLRVSHTDRDFLEFFEKLLLSSCDQEVQTIISLCTYSEYCGLPFVAHIFEVLRALPEADRLLSRLLPLMGCDQAENFTLHLVEVLMAAESTWLLAAEYLAWCPVHGADVLDAMLDRSPFPLRDQQSAHKAMALAQRHGRTAAAQGLARRLGMAAAQSGQMAVALQWMLQAHDPALCAELLAPLVVKVQQQLLAQVGSVQATPLDLPELQDLEPLLVNLPDQAVADMGIDLWEKDQQHLQRRQPARASMQQRPYAELHFLRAMLKLQQAIQQVHHCQQPMPPPPQQQQLGSIGDRTGLLAEVSEQQDAALSAAYQAVRQPVRELLLEGLAPATVQLPLLLYIGPLAESVYTPFTSADMQGLLGVMTSVTNGLSSITAAIIKGSHGTLAGMEWPVSGSGPQGGVDVLAVNAARLALSRGLTRAHVSASSDSL